MEIPQKIPLTESCATSANQHLKISLIVPIFNEEDTITTFYTTVRNQLSLQADVEIVFINDGSSDRSASIATDIALCDPLVSLLNLSRNFGKEAALFAGLVYATGDVVIPIDVDLQDPIELIPEMIKKWEQGYDVVLAKRTDRSSDSNLKRLSAEYFYKFHNLIAKPKLEENVGDYRLMSRRVVEAIKLLPENNLFMKGLLSWVGFPTAIIEYKRNERIAGVTKFNGWSLWNLALEGITSFSTFPLKIWTYIGIFVALISLGYGVVIILQKLIFGNDLPGYPSLIATILFLSGIQLIGIGVLGEYLGRVYMESKRRPKYVIKNIVK